MCDIGDELFALCEFEQDFLKQKLDEVKNNYRKQMNRFKSKDEHLLEGIHFHNKTGKILFDRVAIDSWVVGKQTDESHKSSTLEIYARYVKQTHRKRGTFLSE